jgi:dCTP diphosphatase
VSQNDIDTTVDALRKLPVDFSIARDWQKHQTPKNLAISIAIEAAELMEHFQWGEYSAKDKQEITDELADVLIYCLELSDKLDIDITTAINKKLEKAAIKYPLEAMKADPSLAEYKRRKQAHRKGRT